MLAAGHAARAARKEDARRALEALRARQDEEAAARRQETAAPRQETADDDAAAPAPAAEDATAAARGGGGADAQGAAASDGAPVPAPRRIAVPPRVQTAAEMAAAAVAHAGGQAEAAGLDGGGVAPHGTAGVATAGSAAATEAAASTAEEPTTRQVFLRPNLADVHDQIEIYNEDDDGSVDDEEEEADSDDGAGGSGSAAGLDARLCLAAGNFRDNTPLRRKRVFRGDESPFRWVKRVPDLKTAMTEAGYPAAIIKRELERTRGYLTHVCIKCWLLIPMGSTGSGKSRRWVSSNVTRHFKNDCTAESEKRTKVQAAEAGKQDSKETAMFGAPLRNPAFQIPLDQAALAAQARMYIYSRMHVSKAHFDDPAWREAISSAYELGGGTGKMVFLTKQGLSLWVRAEYAIFEMYVTFLFQLGWEFHEGNAFAQVGRSVSAAVATGSASPVALVPVPRAFMMVRLSKITRSGSRSARSSRRSVRH